ncbi:nucleoside triphosphate pyrophosphohydrolase [Bacillus mesophilum]|uniref:Nucleoside triphosphate pyrophosphohydrolase n=1 Tax=Bacillus mesophilum TaxID=1071718 RepID=A0A7V7RHT7_9BACI|nr:nucleoside triphosphate pyrophosphohydrolase [Bacillus mesophilum]KAB2329139.1 nucleoside triphosphate pyrophosphohydrolase [Bacillus mesophilum]
MNKIKIIGLGAGDLNQLPLGVYKTIQNTENLYLRTKEHPVVDELIKEGAHFRSFDEVYEKYDTFEAVYEEITNVLLNAAKSEDVTYAVPGHPLVAERTVQLLIERAEQSGIQLEVGGGQSFLDALFQALRIDPVEGFQLLDGTDFSVEEAQLRQHIIIGQVYDQFVASDVKLELMERLPHDYPVFIVTAAGSSQENIKKVELVELDREVELNNLTSLYVPPVQDETILYKDFAKLKEIIAILRGPDGCPWDRKQTHESLRKYVIEEAYELIDAINNDDIDNMIEELGDLLLQIMLHAQIGEDEGFFSITDVIEGISEKMVRRHPHVFGNGQAEDAEEVVKNWQEIKKEEKAGKKDKTSLLDSVPRSFPGLMRAEELQKKAASVGFDWDEADAAWEKVKEEIREFEAEKELSSEKMKLEYGDILFAFVNVARFLGLNPEEAIHETNEKFIRRFNYIEDRVKETGREFADFQLEELDQYWEEAKKSGI